jgi:hypothetical protein
MAFRARWHWQRCHVAPPKTGPARSAQAGVIVGDDVFDAAQACRLSRNARPCTSASDRATETPSTRRRSSGPMPIAESTAASRTTPPWRIFW